MKKKLKIVGVIPARYGSSRFRGKILADICGKSMLERVYELSIQSELLDDLYIATDDENVKAAAESFGAKAVMTGINHQSGTDRIAECIENNPGDIIVNIQGDQPLIDPKMIDEAVKPMLDNPEILMSTLKREIDEDEFDDTGVVKVVVDENNFALYFSRSLIPYPRHNEGFKAYEHVGLYVYTRDFLLKLAKMPMTNLEKIESLEQLRVLEKGYKIYVAETKTDKTAGISVDTPEDLEKVVKILNSKTYK
ncbi:MAG TPA: 3-deoxy-manno-octulosonate cytidylyltransferase [Victivallales bacterium]|nr:3-deoxy-manno-octulosonate cytidylyltransferase [Victivallales bacterium]